MHKSSHNRTEPIAKTLDTLEAMERFTAAGFQEDQAKALIHVMAQIDEDLARRKDVLLIRAEMDHMEVRITNRIYAIGLSVAAVVVGMHTLV